ncbi:hypothetical protein HW090_04065 [Pseudomonas sp. ABC1]|uniref:hypothetical protein n=1 Tax=Pseudomonas sp. ABC1 TaxID=2748080 RepID=UPI0015C362A7|nr:hypothetical protein [Pseudomonas sp. ABC1]QLF92416.1 hypothetical protein HW090_04065 [Pseudomonas sp. ABC1]
MHTRMKLAMALLLTLALPLQAHEGHDDEPAPASGTESSSPRFSGHSANFELTGIVGEHQITLYVDHYADNSPVEDATLVLNLNGQAMAVERHAPGEFEVDLAAPLAEGEHQIAARIRSGELDETLSTHLDLHGEDEHAGHDHAESGNGLRIAGLLALLLLVLAGVYLLRKKNQASTRA